MGKIAELKNTCFENYKLNTYEEKLQKYERDKDELFRQYFEIRLREETMRKLKKMLSAKKQVLLKRANTLGISIKELNKTCSHAAGHF